MFEKNESVVSDRVTGVFGDEPETLVASEEEINSNIVPLSDEEPEIKPEETAAEASAPAPAEEEFNFEALSPAAQKKFKELEHNAKSQSGRVSALQRQADDYKTQLEQLQQQGKGDSQAAQNLEEAIEQTQIDLGVLQEELPELNNIVKAFNALEQKVNGVKTLVQNEVVVPGQTRAAQEAHTREKTALTEAHEDFAAIESNPEFWNWVDEQHPTIGALAQSDKAADVNYLLGLYKKSIPPKAAPDVKEEPAATRNIDDMLILPSSGASRTPGDFESGSFTHYAKLADEGKLNKISLQGD